MRFRPGFTLRRGAVLRLALLFTVAAAQAQVQIKALAGPAVLDGDPPRLQVTGLRPGEVVTVHSFRTASVYAPGTYKASPVLAHAQAEFVADGKGNVDVDRSSPLHGTYRGVDALGLLWSGTRLEVGGDAAQPVTRHLEIESSSEIVFRAVAASGGAAPWAETQLRLTDDADKVELRDVAVPNLNGAFARPKGSAGKRLPAILLLHGSEGGSTASARETAIRFANLGYAALAINYFAWPYATSLPGVPQALVDIPVEQLATARAWLIEQPDVDASRVAVWGVSKGAEFALVGAARYAWVDKVVACVPSSVVWSGFGRNAAPGEVYSSWSEDGKGLPYIPYDNYDDVLKLKLSAAAVHLRSLDKATREQRAAARIPIEQAHARLLLLAATKDVVWPSARMTGEIEATMRKAGKADRLQALVFPEASHFICGTGSETRGINPVHKPEGDDPTPEADAHAAAAAWTATKAFLKHGN